MEKLGMIYVFRNGEDHKKPFSLQAGFTQGVVLISLKSCLTLDQKQSAPLQVLFRKTFLKLASDLSKKSQNKTTKNQPTLRPTKTGRMNWNLLLKNIKIHTERVKKASKKPNPKKPHRAT